jgi:hypothetical protein
MELVSVVWHRESLSSTEVLGAAEEKSRPPFDMIRPTDVDGDVSFTRHDPQLLVSEAQPGEAGVVWQLRARQVWDAKAFAN